MNIDIKEFKDIQAIEIIPIDFMLYFVFISVAIVLFSILIYITIKKKDRVLTKEEVALEKLHNIDLSSFDTKQIAYDFTLYTKEFLGHKKDENFEKILVELESYKYIKETKQLDEKIINRIKEYIELCKI